LKGKDWVTLGLLGLGAYILYKSGVGLIPSTGGAGAITGVTPTPLITYQAPIVGGGYTGKDYQAAFTSHVESGIPSTTPGYHPEYQSMAYEAMHAKVASGERSFETIGSPSKPSIQPIVDEAKKASIKSAYEQYAASRKAG
jgi:hypothetical protein